MENKVVYIKPKRNAQVQKEEVFFSDIASVTCIDEHITAKVKALKVYQFRDGTEKRAVISCLKLTELVQDLEKGITVENVGEMDTLIKLVKVPEDKGILVWLKIVFVAFISFFGTAFTIMAFHNDVGIHDVFARLYEMTMGQKATGITTLEVAYSIGLAVGITLFFNHVGGRRITSDPTPIEV